MKNTLNGLAQENLKWMELKRKHVFRIMKGIYYWERRCGVRRKTGSCLPRQSLSDIVSSDFFSRTKFFFTDFLAKLTRYFFF